jgi:hypothetical protein
MLCRSWSLKAVAIYSQVDRSIVLERLQAGTITGCGPSVPELTAAVVQQTPRIVAQMGPEPFLDAMYANPDVNVLIGGRAYDVAPYVAFAAYNALTPKLGDITKLSKEALGGLTHMGKILECGGLCATPKGLGALAVINQDFSVDIRPLDPSARCIPLSVAAHTLYEKSRPDILPGPGGYLDVSTASYIQLDDGITTRVSGSIFHPSREDNRPYTVKLEGARVAGFRTLTMGSFGDPILVAQIHPFLESAKEFARQQHSDTTEPWDIGFHVYGFNDNHPEILPSQVFVVAETLAPSQVVATSLASALRVHFTHGSYPGQKATSGNFGMGIGGRFEIETAECAEFSIYHLMPLQTGEEHAKEHGQEQSDALFRWKSVSIGHGNLQDYVSGINTTNDATRAPAWVVKATKALSLAPTAIPKSCRILSDVAKIIRSKNAGPFEVTLDVMFASKVVYNAVKKSGILSKDKIAQLYGLKTEEVVWAGFFDLAMAFKATVPRRMNGEPSCSGGFMESDVHGSQKYAPLSQIELTAELVRELDALAMETK